VNLKNSTVFQLTQIVDGRPALNGTPALKGILDLDGLPGKVRYGLAKSMRAIRPVLEDIEQCRVKLIQKHATRDENGKPTMKDGAFRMSDPAAFTTEFQELMDVENDIDIHQVEAGEALIDAPGITPRHIETLLALGIIEDEDDGTE